MTPVTIAHATSLRPEDHAVFAHALALASAGNARLFSVKAQDQAELVEERPDAAALLRRWGKDPGSVDHATLIHDCCEDPLDTLLDALRRIAVNLVFVGTHQKAGVARLLDCSHAEAVVANVDQPTLVFPLDARPFIDDHGAIALRRAVIPCGDEAAARAAFERLSWLADLAGVKQLEVVLLSANARPSPDVVFPQRPGWTVRVVRSNASVPDSIVDVATDACIIVMATRRADSLGDMLFGTNTEHVLRTSRCPVLVVPILAA